MTEASLRSLAAATILSWVGKKESDGSHKSIIDLYNRHTPLARGYKVSYTDAWCATTTSAVAIELGITAQCPTECSCSQLIALYQALGRWQEVDTYTPSVGDLMMYDWDDSGSGDCTGAPEHVGMVTAVNGSTITVVEGNKSNAVGTRTMAVGGKYIRGYCTPDYATAAAAMVVATLADALDKLAGLGVIDSPDYWSGVALGGTIPYLESLLIQAANGITKAGNRLTDPTAGIAALVKASIINTPDHWTAQIVGNATLGTLMCALGGAV